MKMPRTKQRNIKENSSRHLQTIREFKRLVNLKIQQVEHKFMQMQNNFLRSFRLALDRYPLEIQNLTLQEILACESLNIEDLSSNIVENPKISKKNGKTNITAVSDDGYESQLMESQDSTMHKRRLRSTTQKKTKTRSQSVSKDRKSELKLNNNNTKDINQNLLKTPLHKSINTFMITPKIKPNAAANILRKPKDGEMVFSTQGSPLFVSTTLNDRTANINVPLKNGNIFSLLPCNETS